MTVERTDERKALTQRRRRLIFKNDGDDLVLDASGRA